MRVEEIGEMIGKGFGVWRSNLNLCIPFLLSTIASMLIFVLFLAAFIATIQPTGEHECSFATKF